MDILLLGGTQFVGRHIAAVLLAAGHTVAIFNRGQSPDELPPQIERLRGDRDQGAAGLSALTGCTWDACVDVCGYTPSQVRPSAELLAGNINRYVYISAVSVYGDPQQTPVTEDCPRLAPADDDITEIDRDTYGPLKVACENIVAEIYGPRRTILRPQIVAGPHDPLDRFSYWVRRAALPGEMLGPGDGRDHLQVIDARDLARFAATVIENDLGGSYNLAGPRLTWCEFMNLLGAKNIAWVPAAIIQSAGITEFELPLFRPTGGPRSSLMHVSNERAIAAGLQLTATKTTIDDTRTWLEHQNLAPALPTHRESELIQLARQNQNQPNSP